MPQAEERFGVEAYFGVSDFVNNTKVYDNTLRNINRSTIDYSRVVARSTSAASVAYDDLMARANVSMQSQQTVMADTQVRTREFANENVRSMKMAATGWQDFTQSVMGQVMQFRSIIMSARILMRSFVSPFQQFIAIGTKGVGIARTKKMFVDMMGSIDAYNESITEMRAATRGTITDTELISSAFRIMRMGMAATAEQAAKVARNVTLLAKMAGQVPSPQAAMQVFSLMMSNQSKMRLDAFTLTIGETNKRIKELKDTLKVSEEEAFNLAVMQLMDERVESMGLTAETAVTRLDRLKATFGNLSNSLTTLVGPQFEDFVMVVERMSKTVAVNFEDIQKRYIRLIAIIKGSIGVFGKVIESFALMTAGFAAAIRGDDEALRDFQEAHNDVLQDILSGASFRADAQAEIRRQLGVTADAAEDAAARQIAAAEAIVAAEKEIIEVQKDVADEMSEAWQKQVPSLQSMLKMMFQVQDASKSMRRRREDQARSTAKRIEQIEQGLADSIAQAIEARGIAIANAAKQRSERLLQIELNFQRAKRSIEDRFSVSTDKAIRNRDALALADAKRQYKKELDGAKTQRDEQNTEAKRQYEAQIQAANDVFVRQEKTAFDSYVKQQQALETSLAEQIETQRIADARKAQDAATARDREEQLRKLAWGLRKISIQQEYAEELAMAQQHYNNLLRLQFEWQFRHGIDTTQPEDKTTAEEDSIESIIIDEPKTVGRVQPAELRELNVNHVVTGQVQAQVNAVIERSVSGFEARIATAVDMALDDVFRRVR